MSASYDPGQWYAGPHCLIDGKPVEWRVYRVGGPLMMVTRQEGAALLAAAAPDMLAALKAVVARYAPAASPANDAIAAMWRDARDAIAKAEGGAHG